MSGLATVNTRASSSTGSDEAPQKPKGKRANAQQNTVLYGVYETNPYPSMDMKQQLADQLGMSLEAIQNWFQNRRQSQKRKIKEVYQIDYPYYGRLVNIPQVLNEAKRPKQQQQQQLGESSAVSAGLAGAAATPSLASMDLSARTSSNSLVLGGCESQSSHGQQPQEDPNGYHLQQQQQQQQHEKSTGQSTQEIPTTEVETRCVEGKGMALPSFSQIFRKSQVPSDNGHKPPLHRPMITNSGHQTTNGSTGNIGSNQCYNNNNSYYYYTPSSIQSGTATTTTTSRHYHSQGIVLNGHNSSSNRSKHYNSSQSSYYGYPPQ